MMTKQANFQKDLTKKDLIKLLEKIDSGKNGYHGNETADGVSEALNPEQSWSIWHCNSGRKAF
jgi:hypothetical protein